MTGDAAEFKPFESTVEQFGPDRASTRVILVGVDGTETSMRAAAFAFGMARRQGVRLVITFVTNHSALTALGPAPATAAEHDAIVELYTELRDKIRAGAEELGVPVTFAKTYGDSYTALRDCADQCQADTVVVGASQKAGHRIAGSVATKLIRTGHWPVLVVP